jgi:hypothetical protein
MKLRFNLLAVLNIVLFAASTISCSKEIANEANSSSFKLYANDANFSTQTRTTLDGSAFKVSWNNNDYITVFNAVTGTTGYSMNLKFKITDSATGSFEADAGVTVPFEDATNYDWFVCSPYNEWFTGGPTGTATDGTFPIGNATQNGYGNTDHIATMDLMVGKATNTREPVIALKHLATLMKFTVKNTTSKPIVITAITVDAGSTVIAGRFRIDLTADAPAIDVANNTATYTSRTLTVTYGTELATNATADFYMILAPFTITAGNSIKIIVNTSAGPCTITKTPTADLTFAAGKFNTANINYVSDTPNNTYLYKEIFDTDQSISGTTAFDTSTGGVSGGVTTQFRADNISTYNDYKTGLSLYYNADATTVNYIGDGVNSCLSKLTVAGVSGTYLWFKKAVGGSVTIDSIPLYGRTDLTLSYSQAGGKIKVQYSVDKGTTWTDIAATATTATQTAAFTVPSGTASIQLRFVENAGTANLRIDNLLLQ